jgi:oxaloacetate decarboxylase alpha subunit
LCAISAIKAGVRIINTAMPPLANGSSNPSVINVAENARTLGYSSGIDLNRIRKIGDGLLSYAHENKLTIGVPLEYQESHFTHQVPGGMISNLRHQLGRMKMIHKLDEVLQEIVQVRKDFGYPIMVTPYSQFVGVQATMNVLTGQRYKELSDQTIQYAVGLWGDVESQGFDPNVKDIIFSTSKAKKLINWMPAELSLTQIREKYGGVDVSDDELILRYLGGNEQFEALNSKSMTNTSVAKPTQVKDLNSNGESQSEQIRSSDALSLIKILTHKNDIEDISIKSTGLELHLSH